MKHTYLKLIVLPICLLITIISLFPIAFAGDMPVYGDVDGDGLITAADARIVLRVSANLICQPEGDAFIAADVDFNGKITSVDARLILRIAAKLDDSIPNTGNSGLDALMPDFPLPEVPQYEIIPDTFVFVAYGFGHGVGMSQQAAAGMAEDGYTYREILSHYYRDTTFEIDEVPEELELRNGEKVATNEILARIVQLEIGGITHNPEALKAQAVTAYTFIMSRNYIVTLPYAAPIDAESKEWEKEYFDCALSAVNEVLGEYIAYEDKPIEAIFGAMSAGITANEKDVWGGDLPYLYPVKSSYDKTVENFITIKNFTSSELREIIEVYFESREIEIVLSENPAEWLKILSHDYAINDDIGYVTAMTIGDYLIEARAGQIFRESIMKNEIRSHCFTFTYFPLDVIDESSETKIEQEIDNELENITP